MLEPWNDAHLQPPPINTFLFSHNIDFHDLLHTCNSMKKVLSKQSPLLKESTILSRFIYKFDRKFRTDIGYRNLKKVNTALRKYVTLNLLKDVDSFLSVLPRNEEDNYVPTQQMLQYLLVRLLSFSKIMERICVCSKQASVYYMDRIKRGESHWMSLMPYALLSRIWSLVLVLLQHSCSWYSCLYPYLQHLQLKGVEFLPAGYTLPADLEKWLDVKNIDSVGRFEWCHKNNDQLSLHFAEEDDLNFDSILDYVKEVNEEDNPKDIKIGSPSDKMRASSLELRKHDTIKKIDEGQSISREYFQSFFNNSNDNNQVKVHSAGTVTNKRALDAFINNEEMYRNQKCNQSLTSHLSFMQWQSLKRSLLTLSSSLSNNRKIERKFLKMWKEKSLDYL